jgi:hypothetical protein
LTGSGLWTLYNKNHFFEPNPIKRYGLIGISGGQVRDSPVEGIAFAEIAADHRRVA